MRKIGKYIVLTILAVCLIWIVVNHFQGEDILLPVAIWGGMLTVTMVIIVIFKLDE